MARPRSARAAAPNRGSNDESKKSEPSFLRLPARARQTLATAPVRGRPDAQIAGGILEPEDHLREHLQSRYRIEVIDLVERPQLSKGDQIFAIPTLVRKLPQPVRKIIGDLSDTKRVLVGLDLRPDD